MRRHVEAVNAGAGKGDGLSLETHRRAKRASFEYQEGVCGGQARVDARTITEREVLCGNLNGFTVVVHSREPRRSITR
jgi:hypothetical protein